MTEIKNNLFLSLEFRVPTSPYRVRDRLCEAGNFSLGFPFEGRLQKSISFLKPSSVNSCNLFDSIRCKFSSVCSVYKFVFR